MTIPAGYLSREQRQEFVDKHWAICHTQTGSELLQHADAMDLILEEVESAITAKDRLLTTAQTMRKNAEERTQKYKELLHDLDDKTNTYRAETDKALEQKDREIASLNATLELFQNTETGKALLQGLRDAAAGHMKPIEDIDPHFADMRLNEQSAQLSAKDREIERLKSEWEKADGIWLEQSLSKDREIARLKFYFEGSYENLSYTKITAKDRLLEECAAALATLIEDYRITTCCYCEGRCKVCRADKAQKVLAKLQAAGITK